MDQESWLTDIATAIADRVAVDWAAAERAATSDQQRELLARLKELERLARHDSPSFGLPDSEPALLADCWGHLEQLQLVGSGTFGDVYRARDPQLDRVVALKILKQIAATDGSSAIVEEARLLAKVKHPNVVAVYGAGRHGGRVGVWMEFIDGPTLEDIVRSQGPLEIAEVIRIGRTLCRALSAVHTAGLLHRDLKAQNVMCDAGGRIVLTDFGAGRLDTHNESDADSGGELIGTPLYLAPEVVEGVPASPRSEVYSLGVLLYHLASGAFPVSAKTLQELRHVHRMRSAEVIAAVVGVRADLRTVLQRALARDPVDRFQDTDEMYEALVEVDSAAPSRLHVYIRSLFVTPPGQQTVDRAFDQYHGAIARSLPDVAPWRVLVSSVPCAVQIAVATLREIPHVQARWLVWRMFMFAFAPAVVLEIPLWWSWIEGNWAMPTALLALLTGSTTIWNVLLPLSMFYVAAWPPKNPRSSTAGLISTTVLLGIALAVLQPKIFLVFLRSTEAATRGIPYAEAGRSLWVFRKWWSVIPTVANVGVAIASILLGSAVTAAPIMRRRVFVITAFLPFLAVAWVVLTQPESWTARTVSDAFIFTVTLAWTWVIAVIGLLSLARVLTIAPDGQHPERRSSH